jgi:superfamily I DNA/RNA helicase
LANAGEDLASHIAPAGYEEFTTRGGRLDFLDLLVKARDLIRDNAAVREELQRRFTHYFVDEFQDTDPIQAELCQQSR